MIRVKICGVRRLVDALAATEAGADAIGFNFWKGTRRYVTPSDAARIIVQLPDTPWKVGVFVDEDADNVIQIAEESGINVLQFHGSETPEYWKRFERFRRIKAFKVGDGFVPSSVTQYSSAAAFLLDASVAGMHGGTGVTADWELAEKTKAYGPVLLAGGLNAQNVGEAIRRVRPWGVDVASGVETEPGVKDSKLIREFMEAVREAEAEIGDTAGALAHPVSNRDRE